jgi:molecular chaperone HscB
MDIAQNYFKLLRLPQTYFVDRAELSTHYRELQKQFHPDKFATTSANEQRLAVQFSAYINTAYQTLKSSVLRAEYLLSLVGEEVDHQSTTISDGQFLMLQMEWRETLGDISMLNELDIAEKQLESLSCVVKQESLSLEALFDQSYNEKKIEIAKQVVAKLHFVHKMSREIESLEASLLD